MKSKVQAASALLLIALVLSFIPAAALPSSASAAQTCTDRAQFITDVTVPDGTRFDPGATFTKTWRLRNIGTCTWTNAYTMVFVSGEPMGSTTSVSLTSSSVPPGQSVDVSVNLTAPSAAGHYIGYWKFKNANGVVFGIGLNADKSWWVEINVTGSTQIGVAYDFTANADKATWTSGAGGLTFPGTEGDAKGFAQKLNNPNFESGVTASQPGLLFVPQQVTNGFIQASYPEFLVQSGDRFQTTVGCQAGATSCYVAYRLDYQIGSTVRTFWTFKEKFEGWTYSPNLNLSPLAGQNVRFILYISAFGSPVGDRALWGNPVIVRRGITTTPTPTATGTPPTATPTGTPGPVPVTVPPSSCDRVQFIADVTVPDRTLMNPGQTFTKTWRLKNVGACTWTTSYQLVFFGGDQMGAPSSLAFSRSVAVGETFDFSVPMTAPSTPGSYRGYWMFKNASGNYFGWGSQGNRAWWVDIRVAGPTVTPGGPTVTPGGPTVTPSPGIAYDFATRACDDGKWFSGAGQLSCPGTEGDARGFVFEVTNPKLESGAIDPRPGILVFPQNASDGYIQGFYPAFRVQNGDRFRTVVSCEGGATLCYALFNFDYQTGTGPIQSFRRPFLEDYEGQFGTIDVDLSFLAGKDVKFILTVRAWGSAVGDRALWVGPHIYRPGGTTPTTATATATATGTAATPSATATPTNTTTGPTATATPTGTTAPPTATPTPTNTTAAPTATPTPTSTTAPPTATPTPTSTTSSTTGLYQNTKYNFRFSLPSGANIVSQSDNVGEVSLPILTAGTNLREKYIQIHVVEGLNPCVSPVIAHPISSESVTINSIPFTKQRSQEGAAGNQYDSTAYSTTYNNACISLAFVLHSLNPGHFPTPPPVFDMAKETEVIGTTMSTYGRIN